MKIVIELSLLWMIFFSIFIRWKCRYSAIAMHSFTSVLRGKWITTLGAIFRANWTSRRPPPWLRNIWLSLKTSVFKYSGPPHGGDMYNTSALGRPSVPKKSRVWNWILFRTPQTCALFMARRILFASMSIAMHFLHVSASRIMFPPAPQNGSIAILDRHRRAMCWLRTSGHAE